MIIKLVTVRSVAGFGWGEEEVFEEEGGERSATIQRRFFVNI